MINDIQYEKLTEQKTCKLDDFSLSSSFSSLKSRSHFNLSIEEYQLKLKLIEPLTLPLCKGKYFRFSVRMINTSEFDVSFIENIIIEVKLFTSLKPHQEIVKNMSGHDILKGSKCSKLIFDSSSNSFIGNFKLKITEISSRYSGINMVIQPQDSEFIERRGISIKPLIIKDLSIKSKEKLCQKLREKCIN